MNKKWFPYVLILVLLIAAIVIRRWQNSNQPSPRPSTNTKETRRSTTDEKIDRDKGFDRRISYIEYSNHAKCRMKCRKISQAEVQEIMQKGKINYSKSDVNNARCPRYALEGVTDDAQRVRIVYAQCNESTTVVTVIDLETDFECHCPGDDDSQSSNKMRN